MAGSMSRPAPVFGGAFRGIAWMGGALATAAAVGVGTVLALVFAATVAVIVVMGAATLGLAALGVRARRNVRADDSNLLEARNIGGHSWVAYGWDQTAR